MGGWVKKNPKLCWHIVWMVPSRKREHHRDKVSSSHQQGSSLPSRSRHTTNDGKEICYYILEWLQLLSINFGCTKIGRFFSFKVEQFQGNFEMDSADATKMTKFRFYISFFRVKMVFCYQNCSDLLWEKKCFSDWEFFLKFEAKDQEFANFLRSLKKLIQTVKGQNNFW